MIVFDDVKDFNSTHIFDCGQCFRWRAMEDGSWTGIAGDRLANVLFEPNSAGSENAASGKAKTSVRSGRVIITEYTGESEDKKQGLPGTYTGKNASRDYWFNYLDLGRDYGGIKRKLYRGDDVMKQAIKAGQGIRILNQDLWETIVSFIISQNNNIPRIKGCIERLADVAGEPIKVSSSFKSVIDEDKDKNRNGECKESGPSVLGLTLKSIPRPEKLAVMMEDDLAEVRLGYRAKYLIRAAQEVLERGMPRSYEEVLALTGVGPKVANCITLFGLRDMSSFPIDVWMRRVMHELYDFDEGDVKGMAQYASKHFGQLSGIAQQYLFYYIRER